MSSPTDIDQGRTRYVFHIAHQPAATRGARVVYMGQRFLIAKVSDSSRLVGIELVCDAVQ